MCKDSTDDDFSDSGSSKTEGYAVLDVEYEVASSSDDDDTLSSVSSGTDVSLACANRKNPCLQAKNVHFTGIRN